MQKLSSSIEDLKSKFPEIIFEEVASKFVQSFTIFLSALPGKGGNKPRQQHEKTIKEKEWEIIFQLNHSFLDSAKLIENKTFLF